VGLVPQGLALGVPLLLELGVLGQRLFLRRPERAGMLARSRGKSCLPPARWRSQGGSRFKRPSRRAA
jgi:hypothetical protein